MCGGTDDSEVLPGSKFLQPPPGPRCGERLLIARHHQARDSGRRRPTREHDPADTRISTVSLLRQLRRRLRHGILLLLGRSLATVRDEDREARDPIERGRGADSHRRHWPRAPASSTSIGGPAPSSRCAAKVVVLGASCVDSTRILLNSKSERHANGLGNGSDVIGRYLCEQIRLNVTGYLPALEGTPTQNDRGIGGEHIYMPRFNHLPGRGGTTCADSGRSSGTRARASTARTRARSRYRASALRFKSEIKRRHPAWFEIHPFGEVLPYAHNRITVDPSSCRSLRRPAARASTIESGKTNAR